MHAKTWTRNNDRDGYVYVAIDVLAMEIIFYKFIVAGEPKDKVMIEDVDDENIKFL